MKAKADGEELQDVSIEGGGLLYEALTSSTASEIYSIEGNVATDTGVALTGLEPTPGDTDTDSDTDTDTDVTP